MSIFGLKVEVDPIDCAQPVCKNICNIDPGKGPHAGELRCANCWRHRGWLSKDVACWLQSIIIVFGRPTKPISVRTRNPNDEVEAGEISSSERARRICEINLRLERAGLEQKDMFLTWTPSRDWWRNQQRQKVMQLMALYKLTAHDLTPNPELPTAAAQAGKEK